MAYSEQSGDSPAAATATSLGRRWRRAASLAIAPAFGVVLGSSLVSLIFGYRPGVWAFVAFAVASSTTGLVASERLPRGDRRWQRRRGWLVVGIIAAVTWLPYAAIFLLPGRERQGPIAGLVVAALEVLAIMIYTATPVRPRIPPAAGRTTPPPTPIH